MILMCVEIIDELKVLRDKNVVQDLVVSLNNSHNVTKLSGFTPHRVS